MSRIGKQPIKIPEKVEISVMDRKVVVKGPKGDLDLKIPEKIKVKKKDKVIVVERLDKSKQAFSLHGTIRTLIANMVEGVLKGFTKTLELAGVGYRVSLKDDKLILKVGFSHPVEVSAPEGINFEVTKKTIKISGIDKQLVGNTAANLRKIRPPDPYKGKGIRYQGEKVKKKPGKAAKALGLGTAGE